MRRAAAVCRALDSVVLHPTGGVRSTRNRVRFGVVVALGMVALVAVGALASTPALAQSGTCSGLSYAGCDLQGVDLTGLSLAGADFTGANLAGANLAGMNLQGANFTGADLEGANLSGANLQYTILNSADFAGANLSNANIQNTSGSQTNFNGANMSGTKFQSGGAPGCTDVGANETGIHLPHPGVALCTESPPVIVPEVNCISMNQDGSFVAYFGYTNTSGSPVSYPIGSSNSITPSSLNGGQPVNFGTGTVSNAFSVTVAQAGIAVWSVNGASATATQYIVACSSDTLSADPSGLSLVFAIFGGGLVGVFVVRRTARGRRLV